MSQTECSGTGREDALSQTMPSFLDAFLTISVRTQKVSELSLLCEELQKRVVCLQSGEEVERSRRQGEEAFGLAERQDQLLEDASERLELLKDESRCVRTTDACYGGRSPYYFLELVTCGGSILSLFFFLTLLLSSFWTSRGHRCRPFSPPVLAFNFCIAHRVQQSQSLLVDFSSNVANSRSRAFRKSINLCTRKSPNEFMRLYSRRGSNSRN